MPTLDINRAESADHENTQESELAIGLTGLEANKASNSVFKTGWKKEPTIEEIKEDLEYAKQITVDQKANVAGWNDLRNTMNSESGKKSKSPGRSSVQPKLIRKHNEWRYPALSEPFLNTERMFDLKPRTAGDKAATEQNQILINWQFDTKLNKVKFIDKLVRTTVDEGSCVVRIGWERKTEMVEVTVPTYEYFDLEDPQQLDMLTQAAQMFMDDPEGFEGNEEIPDSLKASVEYFMEYGKPVYSQEVGSEVVLEEKIVINQPSLKVINVGNFFIDPSCEDMWEEAQYIIHTYEATRSDLEKRGIYKNLGNVNWSDNEINATKTTDDHESHTPDNDIRTSKKKTKVLVYEYWGLYDVEDNNILVPIVVTYIGDTIIQLTRNPFPDRKPPFIIVPYMPIPHSSFGEADASLLQDNQRILGAVTRGMVDLLGRSANAQTGYSKDFLDASNKKRFTRGEDFEFNPSADPRMAIQQMTYPEIPGSALQMVSMQNAEAEGLSGVKSFATGITGDAFGQVARGISGAMDAAGQREMSILRRLAEGVKLIGTKIISMNALFLEDEEVVRVTNSEFVAIKREELAGNFDIIVDISTAKVDEAKSMDLGFMLQTMGPEMDPGLSKIILSDIAKLKRMPELADRIISYEPQPDPIQQELAQLQVDKLKSDIAYENARAQLASAQAEEIALNTGMEMSGINHERSMENQGAQARGNRELEVSKAILGGESTDGRIKAAVGYGAMTDMSSKQQSNQGMPPMAQNPMAPVGPLPQDGAALNSDGVMGGGAGLGGGGGVPPQSPTGSAPNMGPAMPPQMATSMPMAPLGGTVSTTPTEQEVPLADTLPQ